MRRSIVAAVVINLAWTPVACTAAGQPAAKPPTALKAVTATRAAVDLQWTAGDAAITRYVVERKPLGASWTPPPAPKPSPIVTTTVDGTQTKDTSIDAFGTYVYRVRATAGAGAAAGALSAPSNEITVGPPPLGFSQIMKKPSALRDADQFARTFTMTLDANDDPAVAYLVTDPDNNDDASDTTLQFIAWDRAAYAWKPSVTIGVVGIGDWNLRAGLSLAFDATTHRFGLAHMVGDSDLRIAFSEDGVTWRDLPVQKPGSAVPGASLALDRGQVYLAHLERDEETGRNRIRFRTGAQADPPEKWQSSIAPMLPRTWDARSRGIAVGVDGGGKPGVVYWLTPSDDYNSVLAFWRPGESSAVKIADTADHQNDGPDAGFTFRDRDAWVAFYAVRDDQFFNNVHQMWVAHSSDGGATWAAPVPVPADGGNSLGPPVNIAASAAGRAVVTAWVDGGNNGGTRCGQPKLIQSADSGKTWTICSAETATGSPTRDAVFPMSAFARNNKLYIVFKTSATEGALQTGLVLWRER